MSCILNIETSTQVCSVALTQGGEVLLEKVSFEGPSHAVLLGTYVEEALNYVKERAVKLDAVAVSSGPGSYTGLRIGVSMAKGLCFGLGIPLIGIHTLEILAKKAVSVTQEENALYCAMLDARRMEVYAAIYDASLQEVREPSADIVTSETYPDYLMKGRMYFFGNGAAKCKEVLTSENAFFLDDLYPLASDMASLSEKAFTGGKFEDVAYFEPFYLKEFVATIAKNKVLSDVK
ncbi:tRNA (adenosine(37)-N6)-threonylcarbamoyltransferase complex dimerization subunit type 1 TsaB [Parabacteroides pacaensis]|uniref:tRNA (adenosine(37)-N6)-threonylcarbamoyltransferase complex dimerization subunit type 1 TsaB n=1 Tax=Parabacteroides pacaensis TaxID=2086575 RepID=UPI000D10B746|nr:tRNA (adenosine(37)-N6)-threonylcarbamoyltransferase complex dimerization subunit type 1 TsaB [Parabacteroides pacaensis]